MDKLLEKMHKCGAAIVDEKLRCAGQVQTQVRMDDDW